MNNPHEPVPLAEGSVRPHVFDGIAEYNRRLPNWWLLTFYGAIFFSIGYWFYYAQSGIPLSDAATVDLEIQRIEAAKMADAPQIDDPGLWKMSRNAVFVAAGRETFDSMCASCHLTSMRGQSESPVAVGPDLTDNIWIHGGTPTEVYHIVHEGVLEKGMPAWGPVLGPRKVAETAAYILSRHQEGEAIIPAATGAP